MNENNIFIAFLRGINVGVKNRFSMADLKICFEDLGFENVKTFINSGNIIFTFKETNPRKIEIKIEKALENKFKTQIPTVVRSLKELGDTLKAMPKSWDKVSDSKYDVIFLRHTIDDEKIIQTLKPNSEVEKIEYYPGVLFCTINIKNFSKSSISKIIGKPIYKEMTVRNPNTVRKVFNLMQEQQKRLLNNN